VVIEKRLVETLRVKELMGKTMANPKKGNCQPMAKPSADPINQ
jgi:hypothetical protein